MGKKWLKYIKIDFDDFPFGFYHKGECRFNRPPPIPEEDDYCPSCEEEHYECSGLAMDRLDKEDFDVWDIMLTNMPGEDIGDDRFWEWECLVSRQ